MSIADQVQQLQELHRTGAMTDVEFAHAKTLVLTGNAPPAPRPSLRKRLLLSRRFWTLLILFGVGLGAFCSNPSKQALEKAYRQSPAQVADATVTFDASSYGLFSIGKINLKKSALGQDLQAYSLGIFGKWWLDLPVGNTIKEAEHRFKISADALARVGDNGQAILNSAYPIFVTYLNSSLQGIANKDGGYQAAVKMNYSNVLGYTYFLEILVAYDASGGYRGWSLGQGNDPLPPNLHGKVVDLLIKNALQ